MQIKVPETAIQVKGSLGDLHQFVARLLLEYYKRFYPEPQNAEQAFLVGATEDTVLFQLTKLMNNLEQNEYRLDGKAILEVSEKQYLAWEESEDGYVLFAFSFLKARNHRAHDILESILQTHQHLQSE